MRENLPPAIRQFVHFSVVQHRLVQLSGASVLWHMPSMHNLPVMSVLFTDFRIHGSEWSRPRHTSLQNLHRDVIADPRPIQSSVSSIQRPRILFYHKHDPHYGFTNFSYHPVLYEGKEYPTSEHLFQSFKVCVAVSLANEMTLQHRNLVSEA